MDFEFKQIMKSSGQGMVEYGLIIALVAILLISVFAVIGPEIQTMFTDTVDQNAVGEREATLSTSIYN